MEWTADHLLLYWKVRTSVTQTFNMINNNKVFEMSFNEKKMYE